MSRCVLVTVRLHEGRYHGVGDGPPSPARLFQALIAGVGLGGPLPWRESETLEWLETRDPPVVASPLMTDCQAVKNYVPNNDLDAVGGDPRRIGEIRTPKVIRPRMFDANIPFMYAWAFDDDDESSLRAQAICSYADRLYQFGRGVDLAWAWGEVLDNEEVEARLSSYPGLVYRPSDGGSGRTLACPRPGSLRSLKARYAAGSQRFKTLGHFKKAKQLFSKPPKPLFAQVAYDSPPSRHVYELRLASNQTSFGVWPLARVSNLVALLRDGAVARLRQALPKRNSEVERVLVGRKADGTDDGPVSSRVKIVPLPSIGHQHADRGVRRVLVEVPPGCPLRADDVHWAFSGLELVALEIGATQPLIITPSADESICLHYGVGDRIFRVWRTVTPAALPEPARRRRIDPGRVAEEAKGGTERGAEQVRATGAVVQALRFAETRIRADVIRVQREPFEAKGDRVEAFAPGTRFAKERLWHVEITFTQPIKGPLVIGDGRFLGLGVMAPVQGLPQHDASRLSLARFALVGRVLPLVTETLPLAEQARRALLSRCKYLAQSGDPGLADADIGPLCPAFWGKDEQGQPRTGHGHAFVLPTDEDGDGWLDHLTVFAPMGLNLLERQGLETVRILRCGGNELPLVLLGAGTTAEFAAPPLLGPSEVWESATPFVVTRHLKLRGRKRDPREWSQGREGQQAFVAQVLREELERRGLKDAEIEPLDGIGARRLRPLQFQLYRRKRGDDGGQRPHGAFRLRFPAPEGGPIAVGHSCHFGLGLFLPAGSVE